MPLHRLASTLFASLLVTSLAAGCAAPAQPHEYGAIALPLGDSKWLVDLGFSCGSEEYPGASPAPTWRVDDPRVVALQTEDYGRSVLAKAIGRGSTRVHVTCEDAEYVQTVTVGEAVARDVVLTVGASELRVGQRAPISIHAVMSDGTHVEQRGVTTVNSPGIAQLVEAEAGSYLLPLDLGCTILHVATPLAQHTDWQLCVTQTPAADLLAIEPSTATLALHVGETWSLRAFTRWSDGSVVTTTEYATWTSADPAIAAVSMSPGLYGMVTAQAAGDVTVTVRYGEVTSAIAVHVDP